MFETAITDGTKKLGLQEEIAETSRVNTDVAALLIDVGGGSELALLAVGGGGLVGADLLIGVIDEIFLVRHGEGDWLARSKFEKESCRVCWASQTGKAEVAARREEKGLGEKSSGIKE